MSRPTRFSFLRLSIVKHHRKVMNQVEERLKIAKLIAKELTETLSQEERDTLVLWKEENEAHQTTYDELRRRIAEGDHVWKELADAKREADQRWNNINRRPTRRTIWWRYAAAIAIVAATGTYLALSLQPQKTEPARPVAWQQQQETGNDKAILILSNNQKIGLTHIDEDSLQIGEMAVAKPKEKELVYAPGKQPTKDEKLETNRIMTTTGGFYTLTLSDGTRVWLNSETEFEYPVFFGNDEREVSLNGEAYFEVHRDTARPFIVMAGDVRTQVLGTSFNVKAYRNDATVSTTLFTGKVEVAPLKNQIKRVILSPGLQANWNERAGEMKIQKADLDRVAAWKNGIFLFKQEDIQDIVRQIERWYGVTCVLQVNERSRYTFSGSFNRDDSLKSILDMFSFSGELEIHMRQDSVFITDKIKK